MRLRARLSSLACSAGRSTRMTGTEASPSLRAASRRWWPPITDLSWELAMTGSTKPNLADGAGERVQLGIGDPPGVGGVGAQVVDGDVNDGEILVSGLHLGESPYGRGSNEAVRVSAVVFRWEASEQSCLSVCLSV